MYNMYNKHWQPLDPFSHFSRGDNGKMLDMRMNVKLHYSLLLMIISSEGKLFQQNFKAFAP